VAEPTSPAERMRAAGLFDLQPTLPGLLAEVARFLERHRIEAPVSFTWSRDPSRGWTADLQLDPSDLLRVFVDWPMPVQLSVDGEALVLRTEARAAHLSARLPLGATTGEITAQGLVLRPGVAPRS
jgi:hypothetical protein